MKINKENITQKLGELSEKTKEATTSIAEESKNVILKSKDAIASAVDVNGDGKVDVEDIIILGLKTPGVGINRREFLKKELMKNYHKDIIEKAINETPAKAGIPVTEIDLIADNVIQFERTCVTGISAALGMPGGVSMAATIPVDIAQYYGYMLRTAQKLMYLYGFPEIDVTEKSEKFDSETLNILTICLGVMYGVAGANNTIKTMAKALANGVEKKLIKKALTKGTLYPIVKNIAEWFEKKMTKEIFAGFFKKAIPVVGGVVGGGLTYATFKPCCDRLKKSLQNTILSNPDYDESCEKDVVEIEENSNE